jgi:hypothetical protein
MRDIEGIEKVVERKRGREEKGGAAQFLTSLRRQVCPTPRTARVNSSRFRRWPIFAAAFSRAL